jgi:hypothetical protein
VPGAEFRTGSFLAAPLPPCVAVTAVGECFLQFGHGTGPWKVAAAGGQGYI